MQFGHDIGFISAMEVFGVDEDVGERDDFIIVVLDRLAGDEVATGDEMGWEFSGKLVDEADSVIFVEEGHSRIWKGVVIGCLFQFYYD